MPIDPQEVALAKKFEPILLFHPAETFFPVDPKLYLERSALWRSKPHVRSFNPGGPTAEKQEWGELPPGFPRKPLLAKGELAAIEKELTAGKRWLGEVDSTGHSPFLVVPEPPTERPLSEDRFLQATGWDPFVGAPNEVTASSLNRHPSLDAMTYAGALQGGQPWYYAEFLTNADLVAQFGKQTPHGVDLFGAVINNPRLQKPRLLVYHFFYPLHEEPLRGCEHAGEGQTFATFAGDWSSIAILMDSGNHPLFIGLTSRNVGDPTSISNEEQRVGMLIHRWTEVDRVGDHPKIFVSRGTHGNYLTAGSHALTPFTPGDIDLSQGTCAEIETLDDVIPGGEATTTPGESAPFSTGVVVGAIALNFILGMILNFINVADHGTFGTASSAIDPDRTPEDETGGGSAGFGLILRPAGLFVAEQAAAQRTEDWLTKMPAPGDHPRYDFIVDRDTQVWWPPRGASRGYAGRWGPRVTNDPKARRSGMRCPPFALMALEGIARL